MEFLKHISDKMLIGFLRFTSGFARELTPEGRAEQRMWRQQRQHFLKGLSIMSQRRYSKKSERVNSGDVQT
jgi:hypothetical protein